MLPGDVSRAVVLARKELASSEREVGLKPTRTRHGRRSNTAPKTTGARRWEGDADMVVSPDTCCVLTCYLGDGSGRLAYSAIF